MFGGLFFSNEVPKRSFSGCLEAVDCPKNSERCGNYCFSLLILYKITNMQKSLLADGETSHKLTHQQELAAIAKNDPEFFKFLQQQDADLLHFNESDVDSISAGMWRFVS